MRRQPAILVLASLAVVFALSAGGCSPSRHIIQQHDVPQTTIFVTGPVDTVNHTVHLHWYGTEAHGYIAGYELRMLNPLAPADTNWHFTVRTDSVFTIYTPTGYSAPVFEVRAVDDRGVRDPDPARQTFQFSNQPPIVRLVGKPNAADRSDTTFASVTVTWTVEDPDGNTGAVICRVWLDGQADNPLTASGFSFTMPSSRFLTGGSIVSGRRVLYIQGIDDGGLAGPIDSVAWYVKSPVTGLRARLLLVDDVPTTDPGKPRVDTLYSHAVTNAGLAPGNVRVLHLQTSQPFRSAMDLEQTFRQFETVVWYRGEQSAVSRVLTDYAIGANGEGIGPYLDAGGRLFIESLSLVSAWSSPGPLTQGFVQKYLNCSGTFQFPLAPDSSGAWGMNPNRVLRCPGLADSVLNMRIVSGLRAFVARDPSEILIVAPPHILSQDNAIPMPIAMNVPQANQGRFIVSTYPLVSGTLSTPAFPQRASLLLLNIFGLLGLTGP
jgi:hypothetical protein